MMNVADVIKIPKDFFDNEPIITLETKERAEEYIVLYLHLLCKAYGKKRKGVFGIEGLPLTNAILRQIFRVEDIAERLAVLESFGLITREAKSIRVYKCWIDKHNRDSDHYRSWRNEVFRRDNFRCQACFRKENLQAHHIEAWAKNKALRYDVSNGVTLCRECHLKAHGGCWHG
jgi:hypothetical protein